MKKQVRSTKILCANKVGDSIVRFAVQVNLGRTIESVAIVDVDRQPQGYGTPRTTAALRDAAEEYALTRAGYHRGVRIVGAAFDDGHFTGLGQHPEATKE